MKTLTIKGIPESLHARIKRLAKQHHRSLNGEALHLLEDGIIRESGSSSTQENMLEDLRSLRSRMKGPGMTPAQIIKATNEGRP